MNRFFRCESFESSIENCWSHAKKKHLLRNGKKYWRKERRLSWQSFCDGSIWTNISRAEDIKNFLCKFTSCFAETHKSTTERSFCYLLRGSLRKWRGKITYVTADRKDTIKRHLFSVDFDIPGSLLFPNNKVNAPKKNQHSIHTWNIKVENSCHNKGKRWWRTCAIMLHRISFFSSFSALKNLKTLISKQIENCTIRV